MDVVGVVVEVRRDGWMWRVWKRESTKLRKVSHVRPINLSVSELSKLSNPSKRSKPST